MSTNCSSTGQRGKLPVGEVSFEFRKEVKPARKNKHTLDTDMDIRLNEEAQEDSQSDDDSQAHGRSNSSTESALPGHGVGNAAENPNRVGWFLKYTVAIAGANLFELVRSLHLTRPRMAKWLLGLLQLPMHIGSNK
jgi:hypothetical protein